MRGRALEDETINLEQKGLFGLFINSWKRFETDEIKNTSLKIKLPNGIILKTVTDDHGYFKVDELDKLEEFIRPTTKIIYAESPTNPAVDILDLGRLGEFAKRHNLIFIVDNCFATPYLQNPIKFGADLVIHSATKLIDGQGRVLGGITVGKKELIREEELVSEMNKELEKSETNEKVRKQLKQELQIVFEEILMSKISEHQK